MPPRFRISPFLRVFLAWSFLFASSVLAGDPIQRTPVHSTNLASIGYDEQVRVLEIEFRTGGIYHYLDVPKEIFAELSNANSKGRYFVLRIRGKFRFERVSSPSVAGKQ